MGEKLFRITARPEPAQREARARLSERRESVHFMK